LTKACSMPVKDQETEKLFYAIGEVAEIFNVNTSLIRFWETEFDIIKPQKNKKGNRLFTKEDLKNFQLIFHLVKERGYTLQGAKQKLKDNRAELDENLELVLNLRKIRSFLTDLKTNL
jgi:DNA-binding transcriptional MerR regulator